MKKLMTALFSLLMVAACSKAETASIKGKSFQLSEKPAGLEITLAFDANEMRFHGKAINNYFGSYQLTSAPDGISFGAAGATMMAGPVPQMEAEHKYLADLSKITSYKLEGKKLTLSNGSDINLVFEEYTPTAEK